LSSVHLGDITIEVRKLWTIALTGAAMGGFFALFRYSSIGVAMRATAFDQEAALAQGISVRRVVALSWAIAGAVAALAGTTAGTGSAQVQPAVAALALIAFPAMILGGLDSPGGAVVGGVIIGITQTLTAGYKAQYFQWAGDGFDQVAPYLVMILVLLVRPFGLFGTREVRRA
jgi:branched-chain amino acid transport system permease protein